MYYILIILITAALLYYVLSRPKVRKGKVIKVFDGDTVVVKTDKGRTTLRLYGIDAPEHKQEYGETAKCALESLIQGKNITYVLKGKDIYGRTVARIFQGQKDISLIMLQEGHAWLLKDFCDYEDYIKAYRTARKQGKGLWINPNPILPEYFRNQQCGEE